MAYEVEIYIDKSFSLTGENLLELKEKASKIIADEAKGASNCGGKMIISKDGVYVDSDDYDIGEFAAE